MSNQDLAVRTGFAGAVALAAGSGAYAAIIPVVLPSDLPNAASPASAGPVAIDLNGDAVNDFTISFRNPQTTAATGVVWQANMAPVTSGGTNALLGFTGPFVNYGTNLGAGAVIDAAGPAGTIWKNVAQVVLGSIYRSGGVPSPYVGFAIGGTNTGGSGPGASRGFVGFRFDIGGQTRYGWLDLEVRPAGTAAGSGGIYFYGGAYEDSGASIAAGAVPAPASIGLMALGAAGLLRRSKRAS